MKKQLGSLIFLLVFLVSNSSFAQVDTVAGKKFIDSIRNDAINTNYWENLTNDSVDTLAIINEINTLTNDSLIKAYWVQLDSCDQDLHTFCQPAKQAINLLKCCYFFKIHGFSNYNACMHTLFIWIHTHFTDLNYYSSPIITECSKIYSYNGDITNPYFMQVLRPFKYNESKSSEQYQKALTNATALSFDKIDFGKLATLVNEFIQLNYENKQTVTKDIPEKSILNSWVIAKNIKAIIFKSRIGNYYLKTNGIRKLIKINKNIYHFAINIDDTYLEILGNGSLAIKDADGRIIETYLK